MILLDRKYRAPGSKIHEKRSNQFPFITERERTESPGGNNEK